MYKCCFIFSYVYTAPLPDLMTVIIYFNLKTFKMLTLQTKAWVIGQ